jgi:hypothetical protein
MPELQKNVVDPSPRRRNNLENFEPLFQRQASQHLCLTEMPLEVAQILEDLQEEWAMIHWLTTEEGE